MHADKNDRAFDRALLNAAFSLAGRKGWHHFSLIEAAREAELSLQDVRSRYPFKGFLLIRLNKLADEAVLGSARENNISLRDELFDLIMRRFDVFQTYREGIRSVLHALPQDPALGALLVGSTVDTMRWIGEAAGLDCQGLRGLWRVNALVLVWTHAVRAWEKDDSDDLSGTMAALDTALDRAERFGVLRSGARRSVSDDSPLDAGLPEP